MQTLKEYVEVLVFLSFCFFSFLQVLISSKCVEEENITGNMKEMMFNMSIKSITMVEEITVGERMIKHGVMRGMGGKDV